MSEPYSPLRYPGGKARLSGFIISVIQENRLAVHRYVEPYAGGAGAALRLLFEEYVDEITINDADPRVRCFWRAAARHSSSLMELIEEADISVSEWRRQRRIYEECNTRRVVELGFATFFLNRTSRSGIIFNGGPIGGYDQKGKYGVGARFNKPQLIRRIQRIAAYSDRIHVSGFDGLSLLRRLEGRKEELGGAFVYLDPPYYSKGSELYLSRLSCSAHKRLAKFLIECQSFPWILTYDDVPEIHELYSLLPQISFSLSYSLYQRRGGHELLIHPKWLRVSSQAIASLQRIT